MAVSAHFFSQICCSSWNDRLELIGYLLVFNWCRMLQWERFCFEFYIYNSFVFVVGSCINKNVMCSMNLYKLFLGEITIFSRNSGICLALPGKQWLTDSSLKVSTMFDSLSLFANVFPMEKVKLLTIDLFDKLCYFRKQPSKGVLRKDVLKICSKLTGEHPCRSAISIKLKYLVQEIFYMKLKLCKM